MDCVDKHTNIYSVACMNTRGRAKWIIYPSVDVVRACTYKCSYTFVEYVCKARLLPFANFVFFFSAKIWKPCGADVCRHDSCKGLDFNMYV